MLKNQPKPTPSSSPAQPPHQLLVLYGIPPEMPLFDGMNRPTGKTFRLSKGNKLSFETALRIALTEFMAKHATMADARLVFCANAAVAEKAIRSQSSETHIVYYGHAVESSKELAPDHRVRIGVDKLTRMLAGSNVKHFDILGCASVAIAAHLATTNPGIRFGGLMFKRRDEIEVDLLTIKVKSLTIQRQEFFHYGGSPP